MNAVDLLLQTPLFDDLGAGEDINALASRLVVRSYQEGETIFQKGDPGDALFLVGSGVVSIVLPQDSSHSLLIRDMGVGQYFGELSLFDDKPRSATARAAEACTLFELKRDTFHDLIHQRPRIALAVLADMSERLRETTTMLGQRAAQDVVGEIDAEASLADRLAARFASMAGSWRFVMLLIVFVVLWLGFNTVTRHPFDPRPYDLFSVSLAILASLQVPLILMSQNRQSELDRRQARADYRVNLKNEVGIETLQRHLEDLRARLSLLERASTRSGSIYPARGPSLPPPEVPKADPTGPLSPALSPTGGKGAGTRS